MIRAAGRDDVDAITAIYARAVLDGTGSFEIEPPDAAAMAARFKALVGAGFPYLVAEDAGAVLGFAYAGPYHRRDGFRSTLEDSVYVSATARGRGLGSLLLQALVTTAEARGFRQMVAVIGDSANLGSIRLHARAGFAEIGTLRSVGWKHGRWLDVVLMQRALGLAAGEPPSLT